MDPRTKMADRRRYEKRGVAVKASAEGRPLSESATARLHKQVLKKYGEGWEVDAVYPGSIFIPHSLPKPGKATLSCLNDEGSSVTNEEHIHFMAKQYSAIET